MSTVNSIKDRILGTPLERNIAEACNNEPWGASNNTLHEIAEKTFNKQNRDIIVKNIWDILKSSNNEWRRLFKTLVLIEYILKFGDNECFYSIKREIFRLRLLSEYSFKENLEDKGSGIREKAKYLINLLSDEKYFHEEKKKAADIWHKFSSNIIKDDVAETSVKNESYTGYVRKSVGNDEFFVSKNSPKKTENDEISEQKINFPQFSLTTQNEEKKVSDFDIFMVPDIKPAKTEGKKQETDKKQEIMEKKNYTNTVVKPLKPPPSFVPISTINFFDKQSDAITDIATFFDKKDETVSDEIKNSNSLEFVSSENLIFTEKDSDNQKFVDINHGANFDLFSESNLNGPWNPLASEIFESKQTKETQNDSLTEN